MSTDKTSRFCSQCGARVTEGARFCSSCGTELAAPRQAPSGRSLRDQAPGLIVLAFFLSAGLAIWIGVLRGAAPPAAVPRGPGAPPAGVAAGAPAAPGMPPDHPPMQLPDEAKKFIDSLVARAEAAPNDAAAWRNLAQVQARASEIDESYGPKAIESFRRVLTIAPGDPDAIRGIGNLYYDQQQYARAAEQYEEYLRAKPDDPSVRTDLATTYLYEGQVDKAIDAYRVVLAKSPEFLQAHFNLGLAYEAKGDRQQALASLAKARSLADDEPTRTRIDRVTAQLEAGTAAVPGSPAARGAAAGGAPGDTGTVAQNVPAGTSAGGSLGLATQGEQRPGGPGGAAGGGSVPRGNMPAAAPAKGATFKETVENGLRAHSILGPRISDIAWPTATTARVSVKGFPMDAMPEFARNLFRARLETVLDDAKTAHSVSDETAIELVDAESGKTMERVTH